MVAASYSLILSSIHWTDSDEVSLLLYLLVGLVDALATPDAEFSVLVVAALLIL